MNYILLINNLIRINMLICSMKAISILTNQTWCAKGFHQQKFKNSIFGYKKWSGLNSGSSTLDKID